MKYNQYESKEKSWLIINMFNLFYATEKVFEILIGFQVYSEWQHFKDGTLIFSKTFFFTCISSAKF